MTPREGLCIPCLLRDMQGTDALKKILKELIDQIPQEERTPAALAEDRLNICRSCTQLHHGTCLLCGCYVEHRAEKVRARCPDVPDRWSR